MTVAAPSSTARKNGVAALRIEQQIHPEHTDGQQASDEGAEQSVAAVLDGIPHIDTHAEDDADAGKGRVAADETVDDGHQHGTDGSFDGAPAHMELKIFARERWHESVSSSVDAVLSRFFADTPSIAQSEEGRQDFLRK